ncbi:MAG: hypothetical protein GY913_02090 [Proteobacteria bacterium]|nr:hypothetical protein [Pseudomonadota bacterium]MCP4915689.1 hypothetical protein [Pseudomonadota bacterium]
MSETIVHRNVALLKVSDPKVLDEVRAVVPLDDYVLAVVNETELVIDPQRLKDLNDALIARGMTPLLKRG